MLRRLVVSFARSGDTPESAGVLGFLLKHARRETRHLIISCNQGGGLVELYGLKGEISAVVLDPRTNDRTFVMTSNFANMTIALLPACPLPRLDVDWSSSGLLAGEVAPHFRFDWIWHAVVKI